MKLKLLLTAVVLFTLSCKTEKKKGETPKKEITIGYVDGWAEGVAMTHLVSEILTQQEYDVDLEKAAVDLIFASLANGDTDVFMDTWLPVTHKDKVAKFSDDIEYLGVNYNNAKIGLVVPSYVTISSIEELNANSNKFDNKIIGIEKGAGITSKTDQVVTEYNLMLEQLNSSSIAMLSELKKAIGENRWVVVAGWSPHWKFGRFELKFLEDPKEVYGATETIETYTRKNFKTENPKLASFFENFSLDDAQMSDLLAKMEENEDKKSIAKQWILDNKTLVESWLANQ